jgi:phage terminase large subunit GpA-like protein
MRRRSSKKGTGTPSRSAFAHFSRDTADEWFDMATAEAVIAKIVNGYPKRVWQPLPGRENHYLDCRVYNMAAAEKLLLDTLTDADWAALRAERCAPKDPDQGDLLAGGVKPPQPTTQAAARRR